MNSTYSLFPSQPVKDVHSILKKQLQWMLLLRVILYTLLLGITFFLTEMKFYFILLPRPFLLLLLIPIYAVSIVSAIALNAKNVPSRHLGLIQAFFDTLFATCLIYFSGISNSIYTSIYFFPIITGGLIMPKRGGFFSASLATLLYGIILSFEYFHIYPHYFANYDFIPLANTAKLINLFTVKGLTFFLAALVSALFGIRLTSTEEVLSNTIDSYDKLSFLYKTIFDNIGTGIITINNQNRITSANNAAKLILGFELHELLGHDISSCIPEINLNPGPERQAIDFHKDGNTLRIGYSLSPLNPQTQTILKNDTGISKDFGNDSGLITLQDIGKIEELERKIRQGEKLAAIGMMSAGIAHDFRNPLTAISGSAQVLEKELNCAHPTYSSENMELIHIILRESNRMILTISDFLKFARPDSMTRNWFSLRNCLNEVIQVCYAAKTWPEHCTIQCEIEKSLDIWADEKQFFTVMNHLIHNSQIFCPPEEGIIRIRAQETKIETTREILTITVEDNGPGIEECLYEKIFEPFYTNRADGTGLGLAIVKQTVEAHKGAVSIDKSAELGGAKFTLSFPLF